MTQKPTGNRTAAYVRARHGDTQRIEAQTASIRKYADEQGICILKWFVEGKEHNPGNTGHTNPQFQALIAEIQDGRWDEVIVTSLSRFSRFDSIESASYRLILRSNGCKLRTVDGGLLDYASSVGRIMDAIQADAARIYSANLGRASLEGRLNAFLHGKPYGQKCPYGMACRIVDPLGYIHEVSRQQIFTTPKGWSRTLIPGDHQEVETVKRLFNGIVSTGCQGLARQLNAEGLPAPDGGNWRAGTVRRIVTNPVYVGDSVFGRRRTGVFARLRGGMVVKAGNDEIVEHHDTLHLQGTHQGIIDRATWDRVQAALRGTRNVNQTEE